MTRYAIRNTYWKGTEYEKTYFININGGPTSRTTPDRLKVYDDLEAAENFMDLIQSDPNYESEIADGQEYAIVPFDCEVQEFIDEVMPTVGMMVKRLREKTGLNLTKFSEKYKIPYRTLQNWERGTNECPYYVYSLLEFRVNADLN